MKTIPRRGAIYWLWWASRSATYIGTVITHEGKKYAFRDICDCMIYSDPAWARENIELYSSYKSRKGDPSNKH